MRIHIAPESIWLPSSETLKSLIVYLLIERDRCCDLGSKQRPGHTGGVLWLDAGEPQNVLSQISRKRGYQRGAARLKKRQLQVYSYLSATTGYKHRHLRKHPVAARSRRGPAGKMRTCWRRGPD